MDPTGRSIVTWLQPLPLAGNPEEGFAPCRRSSSTPRGRPRAVASRSPAASRPRRLRCGDGRPGKRPRRLRDPHGHRTTPLRSRGRPLGGEVEVVGSGGGRNRGWRRAPRGASSSSGRSREDPRAAVRPGRPAGRVRSAALRERRRQPLPCPRHGFAGKFAVPGKGSTVSASRCTSPVFSVARGCRRAPTSRSPSNRWETSAASTMPARRPSLSARTAPSSSPGGLPRREPSRPSPLLPRPLEPRPLRLSRQHLPLRRGWRQPHSARPTRQRNRGGRRPFLADLDGDGADDPCVRHAGTYLCALSGSGYAVATIPSERPPTCRCWATWTATASPTLRPPRPLLPLRHAHDGGGAELKVAFGLASDLPSSATWTATARPTSVFSGTASSSATPTGTARRAWFWLKRPAGGRAAPRDADGDGRADFCVVRGTQLLCDSTGAACSRSALTIQPGDVVLLAKSIGCKADHPPARRRSRLVRKRHCRASSSGPSPAPGSPRRGRPSGSGRSPGTARPARSGERAVPPRRAAPGPRHRRAAGGSAAFPASSWAW